VVPVALVVSGSDWIGHGRARRLLDLTPFAAGIPISLRFPFYLPFTGPNPKLTRPARQQAYSTLQP